MLPWSDFSRNLFIFVVLTLLDIFRRFNRSVLGILQTLKIEYFFQSGALLRISVCNWGFEIQGSLSSSLNFKDFQGQGYLKTFKVWNSLTLKFLKIQGKDKVYIFKGFFQLQGKTNNLGLRIFQRFSRNPLKTLKTLNYIRKTI